MLQRLLPVKVTNRYQGHALAKWTLAALTLMTIARSLIHMFAADGGAQSIASIPIDTYSPQSANALVTIFAAWGLSQLIIGIVYTIVLWRYQALIPLMYLLFIFEYFMRLFGHLYSPGIETVNTAPGETGNYLLLPLGIVMLLLSLQSRSD